MQPDRASTQVAYRAVLLAAGLLVLGLLFRQLVTLLLAALITVIIAIPLAAVCHPARAPRDPAPARACWRAWSAVCSSSPECWR